MKLFIKNKKYFDDTFENTELTRLIHQRAFKELKNSLDVNYCVPLWLTPDYKEDGTALFSLVSCNKDLYVYEFITTAS